MAWQDAELMQHRTIGRPHRNGSRESQRRWLCFTEKTLEGAEIASRPDLSMIRPSRVPLPSKNLKPSATKVRQSIAENQRGLKAVVVTEKMLRDALILRNQFSASGMLADKWRPQSRY